jgi:hypothetical protein
MWGAGAGPGVGRRVSSARQAPEGGTQSLGCPVWVQRAWGGLAACSPAVWALHTIAGAAQTGAGADTSPAGRRAGRCRLHAASPAGFFTARLRWNVLPRRAVGLGLSLMGRMHAPIVPTTPAAPGSLAGAVRGRCADILEDSCCRFLRGVDRLIGAPLAPPVETPPLAFSLSASPPPFSRPVGARNVLAVRLATNLRSSPPDTSWSMERLISYRGSPPLSTRRNHTCKYLVRGNSGC